MSDPSVLTRPRDTIAAQRTTVRRWRDPRLWLGIVLVLAAVAGGARLLARSDDTTTVVRLAHDVTAGTRVEASDLASSEVRFADTSLADRYFAAPASVPRGAIAAHDLASGDLLAIDALLPDTSPALLEVPLGVDSAQVPVGLARGDRVDVWVVPDPSGTDVRAASKASTASLAAEDVVVLATDTGASGVTSGSARVLVGVGESAREIGPLLDLVTDATVVLVRHER